MNTRCFVAEARRVANGVEIVLVGTWSDSDIPCPFSTLRRVERVLPTWLDSVEYIEHTSVWDSVLAIVPHDWPESRVRAAVEEFSIMQWVLWIVGAAKEFPNESFLVASAEAITLWLDRDRGARRHILPLSAAQTQKATTIARRRRQMRA